jgi:hypothetical protein
VHALVLAALVAAGAPSSDDVRRVAREIVGGGDIQTELPADVGARPERPAPPPVEPERERPTGPGRSAAPTSDASSGTVHSLAYLLLVALGAGVVLLIVSWVWQELRDRRRVGVDAPRPADDADAPAPVPLGVPETLAADGRYAEAIHALLLGALDELARRTAPPPRSFTSREILARVPAAPRAALDELVRRVEVVHFGGGAAAAPDWQRCAELSRAFREGLA